MEGGSAKNVDLHGIISQELEKILQNGKKNY